MWIKRVSYNDGGRRLAGFKTCDVDDCVVRAFSIVTERGYMRVRDELNKIIARERGTDRSHVERGIWPKTYNKYLKELGTSRWRSIDSWEQLPSVGKLFVVMEEHVVAYIDGVINDTFDPVSSKNYGDIVGYWVIE